ncbi:Ig-like domain-containing protein [Sorangium sp. So ce117]|uniref:Ig-like domain-containing protein n=1 Tax=Sorangium sp. So ce117 TaxID=3133277 RepID=UPI003F5D9385
MRSTRMGLRWLGFPSLAALLAACSGGDLNSPEGNDGGGSGDTTSVVVGSGGAAPTPAAGATSSGATSSGATSSGATSSSAASSGAASGSGGGATTGSTGAGGIDPDTITAPEGKIPNMPMPANKINLPRNSWRDGLVSPTLEAGHHQNQPIVINGYVQGAGNAEIVFYDIADPTNPKMLSRIQSPGFDPRGGPKGVGEAESHQTSVARYGDKFYQVTTSGTGVDIWDVTDARAPRHVKLVKLDGINYGDFTDSVWGMYWQGSVIYVGGTNTGLHILDAADPEDVKFVKKIPISQFGGVSAGPLWAVGNTLVITTPKDNGGIATMDISDPMNPVALDFITPSKSYICGLYGKHIYVQSPLRVWDVLTDPTDIGSANSPIATLPDSAFRAMGYPAGSEYMSFSDGTLFLGHLRPDAGVSKIDVRDIHKMSIKSRVWGRLEFTNGDDQFSIPVGSLLVLADDELPYRGMVIAAHSTEPDTIPPAVDTVLPKNGATGLSKKSRVGLSLTDNVEIATVHHGSFIVRPMGGQPLKGSFGLYMGIVSFDPDEDLMPNTTYEIVLPKDGMKDLVGNGIAAEFKSTFTTGP